MQKINWLGNTVLFLFVLIGQVKGQYELNKLLPTDSNVKIGKLANGLTYYIHKNALPVKKIQLRLVVNVGSVLETSDQQGFAHFMEHMNFNGLKHFPKNELVSYLQSIGVQFGADLNAVTGFDETVYFLPIPSDDSAKIEKGFTILEDWAFNALLDTAEINKERGVVVEESRKNKGASERIRMQYFPSLMNGSAYSNRFQIGSDSIINNFKSASLAKFYKTWYRPNLMSVMVVGDIDPVVAEKKIISHFAGYKNPAKIVARPSIIPIPVRKENMAMLVTDKEQPYTFLQVFNFVDKAKPTKTWGDYRDNVMEVLFNQMVVQRFTEIAQQPNPPFLSASANFFTFIRGYKSFYSFANLGDKPVQPAIRAVEAVMESIKKFGFLPTELNRARVNLLNVYESAHKDKDKRLSSQIIGSYVSNYLTGSPIIGIENEYQYLKSELSTITVEEISALAKRTDSQQGFFALLVGTEKSKSTLPSSDSLIQYVTAARAIIPQPYQEKSLAKTLIDRKPVAGKIVQETKDTILGTTNFALSNGITVTLKPTDFKNDEIFMRGWRLGGHHVYPFTDKLNAEIAGTLIGSMGVKDFSPSDLQKFLAGKLVEVSTYIGADDEGIQGRSSLKDLETFFQLVHLCFTQPRKDVSLFQNFVNAQKSMMVNQKSVPIQYFIDTLRKVAYNNHPYAPVIESPASYEKLNLDRSLAIYKEVFGNADGLHFTFVGNIDIDKMKQHITTYLGSLPSRPAQHNYKDVGLRPAKGPLSVNVKRGAEKQSYVVIQYSGEIPFTKETDLQLMMLSEVMNFKISEKLREEMGGIYQGGMRGGLIKRPYEQYSIEVNFPCAPENVDKLVAAYLGIVKDVSEKGIDEKDIAKVKETLIKQYEVQIKNNDLWLEGLSRFFIDQTDPAWILAYPGKVEGVTAAQLQQLCKKLMDTPNYIKAVLYPEN